MRNTEKARWIFCLLAFLLILTPPKALAQENKITGTVVDTTGEPIIGATVVQKGNQSNGTATDLDGNFAMTLTGSGRTIVVSYIGMETQELTATPGKPMKIILRDDNTALDEVEVIGYVRRARKELTG